MLKKKSITLITNTAILSQLKTIDLVKEILPCGLQRIQIREKSMPENKLEKFVSKLRELTLGKCELILNGPMALANKYQCDGIHASDKSELPNIIRKNGYSDLIIGKSIHENYKKENGLENFVNYVHLGPTFITKTHPTSSPISRNKIKEICEINGLSVILVGGINTYNLDNLKNYKINGIAVMRSLLLSKNPESSYIDLEQKLNESR
ncbi:MAG: thiamine phosphate synthase [Chloroflexota bacterium]|nr:thiamine phosphate synthase [Chloroflexota bacterium]